MRIAWIMLFRVTFIASLSMLCTVAVAGDDEAIVSEKDILRVCYEPHYDPDKTACLNATKESLFDFHALNFCRKQMYDSDKAACYRIVANKKFSSDLLAFCEKQYNDLGKRNCLKAANFRLVKTPAGHSPIQTKLDQALEALENKDYGMAEKLMYDLKRHLNQ